MKAPSLRDLAAEVGVSAMTISRALRGHPYVKPELREKVRLAADKIGYRCDPKFQRMMNYMRQKKNVQSPEVIAMVWPDTIPHNTTNPDLQRFVHSARTRADSMGFKLEEYYPKATRQNYRNLSRQLYTRGISIVIFSMVIERAHSHASLDWKHFSCISVGEGLWRPRLHRTQFHHYYGMMETISQLRHKGYRRIGALLVESIQKRMHRSFTASFLANHPLPPAQAARLLAYESTDTEKMLRWLEREKPDVLICDHPTPPLWLKKAGFKVPQKLGYASLHRSLHYPETSGIDQREDLLGENAVELAVSLYYRHEHGVPSSPKIVLYEGTWVNGKTTRSLIQ